MTLFQQEVETAVDALLLQQVILYPTDTVWGVGCDAESSKAVERLYKVKNRAEGKPSIVLVADVTMFAQYAAAVPDQLAELLASETRPTTYIVPASKRLSPQLVGPDGTVGLRIPQDEFCHKLVRRLGHGLVSTSANRSGEPTPAVYAEVDKAVVRAVDHVVSWRQDDDTRTAPSRVVRLEADGQVTVVRE